jgi:hypothetical protein
MKHTDSSQTDRPSEKLEHDKQTDLTDVGRFCMMHFATEQVVSNGHPSYSHAGGARFESQSRTTNLNDLRDFLQSLQANAGKILLNWSRPLPARHMQLIIYHSTIRRSTA